MNNMLIKGLIVVSIIVGFFVVLSTEQMSVDYEIVLGNTLEKNSYSNAFITNISSEVAEYEMEVPSRFSFVVANEYLELYLEEATMGIAVVNKDNGYIWYSYDFNRDYEADIDNSIISEEMANQIRSGVILRTYNVFTPGIRTLLDKNILGNSTVDIQYEDSSNGFIAHIDFERIMISLDVEVMIDGEDLVVSIPWESILEYDENLWEAGNNDISLNDILVYPFFGSTESEDNGYIVIPDGTGALINLEEDPDYNLGYSAPIYGKDIGYSEVPELNEFNILTIKPLARVTLPIYGIVHDVGNAGLLVISESGANYATYNYISKDLTTEYYQSFFEYNYRTSYKQFQSRLNEGQHILGFQPNPNEFDLVQRYVFLSSDASYVGVAKGYREFLEDTEELSSLNISSLDMSLKLDIIGSEVEQGVFFEKDVITTPYNDAVEMIKNIEEDGFNNINITYKSFDKSSSAYRFDIIRGLGSKNDFSSMISYFDENDINFEYYVDYVNSFENTKYSASRVNRLVLSELNYSYMYLYRYLNNIKHIPEFVRDDISDYNKYNIKGLSIDGLDSALFTYTEDNRELHYSTESIVYINEALNDLENNSISTSFYNPDSYLYKYTDNYYDIPLSSSELMFIDATVPLLQLVVSGYMEFYSPSLNFISSERNTLLRMVEYGINPSYILTSEENYLLKFTNSSNVYISEYSSLRNRMISYNSFLENGLNSINNIEMVNHVFLESGVSMSVYSNGVVVIVNYNDFDITYDGNIIYARGYDVL